MSPRSRGKAVVLLSGGLDSAVAASWALAQGYEVHALSFRYGQVHARELASARVLAKALKLRSHREVRVDLGRFGGSSLTGKRSGIPLGRSPASIRRAVESGSTPSTYVPARNSVFLSLGASRAEALGAESLVIGANALDYSGYVDCRPRFLKAMEKALVLGTARSVGGRPFHILAPLLRLNKAAIVKLGLRLNCPLGKTWSCYLGGRRPCGRCDSCVLRAKGFQEAGREDPAL